MLLLTLAGLFLEIISGFWYFSGANLNSIFYQFTSKLTVAYFMLWAALFVNYIISICNVKKQFKKYFNIYNITCFVLVLILPIHFIDSSTGILPAGLPLYITYGNCFLYAIIDLIICLMNRNKIAIYKFTPVYTLLLLGGLDILLSVFFPFLFLMNYVYSLIIIIMYFTIENPDIRMVKQLELARDQAEKASHAKSDFLSSMSHEIRTPLNAIVGFSEDIQNHKDKASPEIVEDADYIMEASKTLLEIVGNILDINKLENNQMEIVEVNYNPREEIESIAKIDSLRIGEKAIDFRLHLSDDLPQELYGDKIHIKEIVNNLLTNAIKYTDKGIIELAANCVNKNNICNLKITVKDTGRGFSDESLTKLFTKFERLDAEKNSTTEGTGLGLAITKTLVEMLDGTISVQSQYGKGSIFTVNIPQKIIKSAKKVHRSPIKLSRPIRKKEQNILNNSGNKRVLIVDDNLLNIKVAKKALEGLNLEIDECYDGIDCLTKINEGNKYDLILMDIMMPNMNGEVAMEKLQKISKFNVPVIAVTADAINGAKEKYLSEGFVDYIAKPFNKEQIKEKLDKIFR